MRLLEFVLMTSVFAIMPSMASAQRGALLGHFKAVTQVASTVPANGDVNPYGIAVVPESKGRLHEHSILVSNFNDGSNAQGTGTTIVQVSPGGHVDLFAEIDATRLPGPCPGGVGLTTALAVLHSGWVIVGSLPTSDGTAATAQPGCLLVLDSNGQVKQTLAGSAINGPWDMTAFEMGPWVALFVTNVLPGAVAANGDTVNQATVLRIWLSVPDGGTPREVSRRVIGSEFGARTDPDALVIGPTGVGLGRDGTLFVADTLANRIAAIPHALFRSGSAMTGRTVSEGGSLNGPLGLAVAHDGHILTTNGGDGNIVETTPTGQQISTRSLESSGSPPGAGALFGLALNHDDRGIYFVDDADNTLKLLR